MADNAVNVGEIITRFVGDATQYQATLKKAMTETVDTAKRVEEHSSKIEKFADSLEVYAKRALGVLGLFGVAATFKGAFEKYLEYEKNVRRLTAAIEANGRAVGPAMEQYKNFAKVMVDTTPLTKGAVFGMIQQAEAMGVYGDGAEKAVKAASALAAVTGQEASSLLRATVMAQQGNYHMLRRIPILRGIRDEQMLAQKYREMLVRGEKLEQEETQSLEVQMKKLKATLMEITLEMGRMVAIGLRPVVAILKGLGDGFKSLDTTTRAFVTTSTILTAAIVPLQFAFGRLSVYVSATRAAFEAAETALMRYKRTGALAADLAIAGPWVLGAAGAAALAVGVGLAAHKLSGLSDAQEYYNTQLKIGLNLDKELLELRARQTEDIVKRAELMPADVQAGYLKAQLKRAEQDKLDAKTALDSAQKANEYKEMPLLSLYKATLGIFDTDMHEMEQRIKTQQGLYDSATDRVKKFSEALKKLDLSDELQVKVKSLTESVKKDLATLGFEGATRKFKDLQQQAAKLAEDAAKKRDEGDEEAARAAEKAVAQVKVQLGNLKGLFQMEEAAKAITSLNKHIKDTSVSMVTSIATFGLAGHEADLLKDKLKGASDAVLELKGRLGKGLDVLEFAKGLADKGKQLEKEFQTPLEKFLEEKRDLDQMYRLGAIGVDTYAKALWKAQAAAQGVNKELDKVDSFTSAETLRKFQAYMESIKPGVGVELPKGPAATPEGRVADAARFTEEAKRRKAEDDKFLMDLKAAIVDSFKEAAAKLGVAGFSDS